MNARTATHESRSNQVISEYRRPVAFAGAVTRGDIFLKVKGAQVAMGAAIHPVDYTHVETSDLIEMAKLHLAGLGFCGIEPNSRGTALAALIGITMGGR